MKVVFIDSQCTQHHIQRQSIQYHIETAAISTEGTCMTKIRAGWHHYSIFLSWFILVFGT